MAVAVLLYRKDVCNEPFLIKQYSLTAGTDGLAITHGEAYSPDIVVLSNATTGPTATEASYVHTSATITTLDFEAAAGTYTAWFIWVPQANGGIS